MFNDETSLIKGRYRLREKVGVGAFGAVFRGMDMDTGNTVAIKRVPIQADNERSQEQLRHFAQELQIFKRMNHRCVVRYLDDARTENYLYILMEYAERHSLLHELQQRGPMTEEEAIPIVQDMCTGLAYMHRQGVLHRDVKAANVLLSSDNTAKLSDFGLAVTHAAPPAGGGSPGSSRRVSLASEEGELKGSRRPSVGSEHTPLSPFSLGNTDPASAAGAQQQQQPQADLVGSVYWMAPEVIQLSPPSKSSDIWSLGATVVEMLTGKPPFYDRTTANAMYHLVQSNDSPVPEALRRRSTPELLAFLDKCFDRDSAKRATASQLVKEPWLQQHPLAVAEASASFFDLAAETSQSHSASDYGGPQQPAIDESTADAGDGKTVPGKRNAGVPAPLDPKLLPKTSNASSDRVAEEESGSSSVAASKKKIKSEAEGPIDDEASDTTAQAPLPTPTIGLVDKQTSMVEASENSVELPPSLDQTIVGGDLSLSRVGGHPEGAAAAVDNNKEPAVAAAGLPSPPTPSPHPVQDPSQPFEKVMEHYLFSCKAQQRETWIIQQRGIDRVVDALTTASVERSISMVQLLVRFSRGKTSLGGSGEARTHFFHALGETDFWNLDLWDTVDQEALCELFVSCCEQQLEGRCPNPAVAQGRIVAQFLSCSSSHGATATGAATGGAVRVATINALHRALSRSLALSPSSSTPPVNTTTTPSNLPLKSTPRGQGKNQQEQQGTGSTGNSNAIQVGGRSPEAAAGTSLPSGSYSISPSQSFGDMSTTHPMPASLSTRRGSFGEGGHHHVPALPPLSTRLVGNATPEMLSGRGGPRKTTVEAMLQGGVLQAIARAAEWNEVQLTLDDGWVPVDQCLEIILHLTHNNDSLFLQTLSGDLQLTTLQATAAHCEFGAAMVARWVKVSPEACLDVAGVSPLLQAATDQALDYATRVEVARCFLDVQQTEVGAELLQSPDSLPLLGHTLGTQPPPNAGEDLMIRIFLDLCQEPGFAAACSVNSKFLRVLIEKLNAARLRSDTEVVDVLILLKVLYTNTPQPDLYFRCSELVSLIARTRREAHRSGDVLSEAARLLDGLSAQVKMV